MLELKALREGAWKLSKYTTFASNLVMRVSRALHTLLKVANKAHPKLHAMLVDLMQYKPKLLIDEDKKTAAPPQLGMDDPAPDPEPEEPPLQDLQAMAQAEAALS